MANKEYAEKLKSPLWQQKRLRIMERDGWKCGRCGSKKTLLHVHHIRYNGGEPWDSIEADLITLCEPCHTAAHEELKKLQTLDRVFLECESCCVEGAIDNVVFYKDSFSKTAGVVVFCLNGGDTVCRHYITPDGGLMWKYVEPVALVEVMKLKLYSTDGK